WVFPDWRLKVLEVGNLEFDACAQLRFRQVGVRKADIVWSAPHLVEIVDRMHEDACDIADVNVIALKMRLKQHDKPVINRAINKIVDQEVDAHARRHAKNGGNPKADSFVALQHDFFRLDLVPPVKRNRPQRRVLGTEFALLADAVAAVSDWHNDALLHR